MSQTPVARSLSALFLIPVVLLTTGITQVGSPAPAFAEDASVMTLPIGAAEIHSQHSRITVQSSSDKAGGGTASVLVPLPYSARTAAVAPVGATSARVSLPDRLLIMRGRPVARVLIEGATETVTFDLSHDGDWQAEHYAPAARRLVSPSLDAALSPTLTASTTAGGGSYVIIHAPAFQAAVQPLADWKLRKGLPVVTVSTGVTGVSTSDIKAWLQDAYDTWDRPPEYVVLVGDVADIPTFSFEGNPSDLAYTLLDGDDWLPDAMVGRLPVENDTQAQTLINKIVAYERSPYTGDMGWYTRSLMVAGLTGSTTPPYTVEFCGEQLESIGFDPATAVTSPIPFPAQMGGQLVKSSIDAGVSMVVYRGWAYGTAGWDPPTYTVDDIPALTNGAMLPVVMSFVCLTGDYSGSSSCFGEVFIRQGTPAEPLNGSVAFIGNGEHWSHTRFNDAMAISFFERITDTSVNDLGSLMTAGKLRFWDYFPLEVDAETYGEESVEFYFHIYNLLGDPEMNFWKSAPQDIDVIHAANLPLGANSLQVTVTEDGGGTGIAGARVGVVQNGALIGNGVTDIIGQVDLTLQTVTTDDPVYLTVTGPGLMPYEATLNASQTGAFVSVTQMDLDDMGGNDDDLVNPGETVDLTPTMTNHGTQATGAFNATITDLSGPASVVTDAIAFDNIEAESSATATTTWRLDVDPTAAFGDVVRCIVDVTRPGDQHDVSVVEFTVSAPDLMPVSFSPVGANHVLPGATTDLVLSLTGAGDAATGGGTVTLTLLTIDGASLTQNTAPFGACDPGQSVTTDSGLSLNVDASTATGTALVFDVAVTTIEGYESTTTASLVVGDMNPAAPIGPDAHGYYAYDSADLEYPDERPAYAWQEISTAFGGPGTEVELDIPDNLAVDIVVDLPFTFRYYGQDYTRIRISDNGWISFDLDPFYNFYNWTMPSEHGNDAVIAPFWDNLNPEMAEEGEINPNGIDRDGVYYYHDADAGTFIVEWSRMPHYKPADVPGLQTFQVVLFDPSDHVTATGDGEILFLYRQVTNIDHLRMYATVGIESPDGTDGILYTYSAVNTPGAAALQPGLAVKLTTDAPVRVPFTVSSFDAAADEGGVSFDWTLQDERRVLGWHLDAIGDDGIVRLTETPLPAEARSFRCDQAFTSDGTRYQLTALHAFGGATKAGQTGGSATAATRLSLAAPRPNPAPGNAGIAFALPRSGTARLRVYDVAGRLVRTLLDGHVDQGPGFVTWDGRSDHGDPVAGGVYFYRLETTGQTLTRKLLLVR